MLSLHTQKITILLMSKKMYICTSKKSECHWKDYLGCAVCKQLMHNNIYMAQRRTPRLSDSEGIRHLFDPGRLSPSETVGFMPRESEKPVSLQQLQYRRSQFHQMARVRKGTRIAGHSVSERIDSRVLRPSVRKV